MTRPVSISVTATDQTTCQAQGFRAAERKSDISQIRTPNTLWGDSDRSRGQECMWEPGGSFDDKVFCVFDKLMLMLGSL